MCLCYVPNAVLLVLYRPYYALSQTICPALLRSYILPLSNSPGTFLYLDIDTLTISSIRTSPHFPLLSLCLAISLTAIVLHFLSHLLNNQLSYFGVVLFMVIVNSVSKLVLLTLIRSIETNPLSLHCSCDRSVTPWLSSTFKTAGVLFTIGTYTHTMHLITSTAYAFQRKSPHSRKPLRVVACSLWNVFSVQYSLSSFIISTIRSFG